MAVKTSRRAIAAAAVGALAAASTLFLGVSTAHAVVAGFSNPVGTVTIEATVSTITLTQDTDVAVVNFVELLQGPGETLDIVQDEGDVLIIRNTGVMPTGFEGTLTADATVIITSPLGIGVVGSLRAEEDLILTTGAITDADTVLATIPIDPAATDGIIGISPVASLTGGNSVAVIGDYVFHQGSLDALDGYAQLASVDTATYNPNAVPPISAGGPGLAGGGVAMTGSIYVNGVAFVLAPSPAAWRSLAPSSRTGKVRSGQREIWQSALARRLAWLRSPTAISTIRSGCSSRRA